jgi:tetratricopeptide (TPR) repeat protein
MPLSADQQVQRTLPRFQARVLPGKAFRFVSGPASTPQWSMQNCMRPIRRLWRVSTSVSFTEGLTAMPGHPIAAAIRHFEDRRFEQAEAAARVVLQLLPQDGVALNLLAVIACRRGDMAAGIDFAVQVLTAHPQDVQALELLGDAFHALRQFGDAADAFGQAAGVRPRERRFHAKQAYALHENGQHAEAVAAYERAIALGGGHPALLLDYGKALVRLDRVEEAGRAFSRAVAFDPDCGLGWKYQAEVLSAAGRRSDACAAYRRALLSLPEDVDCHFNLARLLNDTGRSDEALLAIDRTIALKPDFVEAHSNRSATLRQLGRFREAVEAARAALRLKPTHVNALSNLGNALTALGHLDAALKVHLRAVALAPTRGNILANVALTLQEMGAEAEAISLLERAVALDPDKAWPQFNLALIRLKNGDFERGWDGYRWRWKARNRDVHEAEQSQPRWDERTALPGRLMIWSEQGIGDEIMFAGLVPQLAASGISCAIECDPRLLPLFRRSFPEVPAIARGDAGRLPQDIVSHVHAGELPRILRPDRGETPWFAAPYLHADAERTAALRARYGAGKPLVGLAWYSANPITGARRSIAIDRLAPLLERDELGWVSLQYGDLDAVRRKLQNRFVIDPQLDPWNDLDGFAAQIAALDAVVTIDSSVAHFAGALGKPTLLLLSFDADWRWMRARSDAPWYAGVSILRQPRPGDWDSVIEAAQRRLPDLLGPGHRHCLAKPRP